MKIMLTILSIVIILCSFSACSNKIIDDAEAERVTNVYKSDYINLPDNINMSGSEFYIYDNTIYFTCYEILNEETWETRYALYSVGLDGTGENIKYDLTGDNEYINQFTVMSDGKMMFLIVSYDEESGTQTMKIDTYDQDFNLLNSFDPTVLFNNRENMYINRMVVSTDDVLYITIESTLIAVTPDGEKLFELECSDYINQMNAANDGKIVVSYYEIDQNTGMGGYVFRYVDPQKKDFGDTLELPQSSMYSRYNNNVYFTDVSDEYEYYFKDSYGVYGCNNNGVDSTLLMNFINSDINPEGSSNLKVISPERFVYHSYDYFTSKMQISILTRIPDDEVIPKKIINMALFNASELYNAVVNFNRQSDEYRIVMEDYSRYSVDNYNQGQEKLDNDILSGKIADIMVLSSYEMNKYINKGLFTDLYDFIEDKNMLLQCVRNVYETDGKLYQLPMTFYISAFVGKTSIFGSESNWTLSDMIDIMEQYPDSYLMPGMSKYSLTTLLLSYGIHDYIDYDKATCDFENEEFINILNYIYGMELEEFYEIHSDYWEKKKEYIANNVVLLDSLYFSSFSDYISMKSQFNNEEITIKGYPSKSSNGIMMNSGRIYTISNKSNVKNGAWAFFEYMLSDDVQGAERNMYDFPVTESGFKLKSENEKSMYYFFYHDGGWARNNQPLSDDYHTEDKGVHARVTDEDVQFVYNLLNQIDSTISVDETLMNIINEEIEIFLEGQKSAEEIAKVIQSRIGIYISENY